MTSHLTGQRGLHVPPAAGRVAGNPPAAANWKLARVSAAALAQEQAEDVALLVGERAEAGRGALDPLPVVGGQVILVFAAAPGRLAARGVRPLIPARAGVMNCPEPVTHDSR